MSDMSLQGSCGMASSASLIEHLQSLLKQKEGALFNSQVYSDHFSYRSSLSSKPFLPSYLFQNLVGSLERFQAAMAEDLGYTQERT